ncbi:MAG: hypothetical protein KC444_09015 [Nitrosopumilus sp.]|nr:hypothetical protein [Nitrosopumilus sp.]
MAKNERILAQDLAELKHAIQNQDAARTAESCRIISRDVRKYPVKPEIIARLEHVLGNLEMPIPSASPDEKIDEIGTLIDILVK